MPKKRALSCRAANSRVVKESHANWLLDQLPDLVAKGVLNDAAAESVRAHYTAQAIRSTPSSRNIAVVIFSVLGGLWISGPYLTRANGDSVQLAVEARTDTLGLCQISGGKGKWSATVFDTVSGSPYQVVRDNGLAYGLTAGNVTSVTIDNAPAAFETGMFVAEATGPFTLVVRDAQGNVVGQGTIN